MKQLLKNPLTVWFTRLLRSKILEFKHRGRMLKIGYLSNVQNCTFGRYNTLYDNILLSESHLGDFTYIANGTQISKTSIGKFCSIGPNCKIGLGKHPSDVFVSTHPIFFSTFKQAQITFSEKDYFEEFENIIIGNDVWVGANAIIIDGVKINDGAIIAAGSVVTKDVPPYAIVGGVPAKIIRFRFDQIQIEKLIESQWWNCDIDYLKQHFKIFHNIDDFEKQHNEFLELKRNKKHIVK